MLTPNLRVGEFFAQCGQHVLCVAGVRMRGTKNPASPLDHVLHYRLGFEQVVACVEIETGRRADVDSNAGRRGCTWGP